MALEDFEALALLADEQVKAARVQRQQQRR